jgi:hypothetical protein
MKRFTLLVLVLLCSLCATAARAGDGTTPAPAPGQLIVHEWGTFTGLAGSDGVHLPFRAGIGSDLPPFVFTRAEQAARLTPDLKDVMWEVFTKNETVALQRMETPVVYFYTDAPREVEARVDFPQGMLTEFYPPVRSMTPAYDLRSRSVLQGSSLDWGKIRIAPASASANVPKVEGNNHYAHARETDAATVQFSDRPGEVHEENFLFYRGLGDFTLPVTLAAVGGNRFVLHNSADDPIATAFLIRIKGGTARFSTYRNVARRQEMTLPSQEVAAEDLAEAVVTALVAEGLYEKEARAMVKTWESNWFGEEGTGTRLLYTLPRRVTDGLLPLRINPTPDETVRVLVGRIDVLTPEQEAKLASMFPRAGTKGAIGAEEAREARALGRFLKPALERAAKLQARQQVSTLTQAIYAADPG